MTATLVSPQWLRKQRATNPLQKEQRRANILATAARLITDQRYDDISMADVAKQTGVAKGTLYLYFPSKESLFLALVSEQLDIWFGVLCHQVRQQANATEPLPTALAQAITDSLRRQPILLKLIPLVNPVLEYNVEPAQIRSFKCSMVSYSTQLIQAFSHCHSGPDYLSWNHLSQVLWSLIVGLQSVADPSPGVRDLVATDPYFRLFKVDFFSHYQQTCQHLLEGLLKDHD